MKLTERVVSIANLALSDEQSATRSEGLHVSSIIRYLKNKIGKNSKNDFTEIDLDMFAMVGRMFEAQLAKAMFTPPRYERVGELEKDGVIGSPDAIDTQLWSVLEFKATWQSASRPIEDRREWFWQMQSYCHLVGTPRASLFVFYVNGNYRPTVPVMRAWDFTFTQPEILSNWQMILQASREMGNE